METSITTSQKNTAAIIHLSVFSQFIFPLGNFIAPLIIWGALKRDSLFVDNHGRRALNFQMSTFIYAIGIIFLAIPFLIWQGVKLAGDNRYIDGEVFEHFPFPFPREASGLIITAIIFAVILLALFVITFFSVISAAVSASNGEEYKYPLTINFLKPLSVSESETTSASSSEV